MNASASTAAQLLGQLAGAIVGGGIRVIDLTVPLESATPTIQLPPPFAPSKPFRWRKFPATTSAGPPGIGTTSRAVSIPAHISMRPFTG
jgi:hypothetical protein